MAQLTCAHLQGTSFSGAYLHLANFESSNLNDTNFEYADFLEANLSRASLEGANFEGANLAKANLCGVRGLDKARGLEKVKSWQGAKIERKWVERLGLDADELGLKVVDDLEEDDLEEEESKADTESR